MSETNNTRSTAQIIYNVNDINNLLSVVNSNKDIMTIPVETSEVKANKVSTNELSADNFIGGQVTAMTGFSSSAPSFLTSIETNNLKINSDNTQIDVKDSLDIINQSIESLSTDLGSNVNEYLQSEEAQDIIISATGNTIDTKINTALEDYSPTIAINYMISSAIIQAKREFLDLAYPIGSIYMSMDLKNPASLFGGTWEQVSERFLFGASSLLEDGTENPEAEYKIAFNDTDDMPYNGGSETVALTINEIPSHNHFSDSQCRAYTTRGTGTSSVYGLQSGDSFAQEGEIGGITRTVMHSVGGGESHNNMPPYTIVYIWKRTA